MKGVPFLSQMVYKSIRVWTLGQSLPVFNFVECPPPPPGVLLTWKVMSRKGGSNHEIFCRGMDIFWNNTFRSLLNL